MSEGDATIRKSNFRYKQWKKKQDIKNLKRRSIKKKKSRLIFNGINPSQKEYVSDEKKIVRLVAPRVLSLVDNYDESLIYFNELFNNIHNKKNNKIFCDLSEIMKLTIDALMYFIAILTNKRKFIFGNEPINNNARNLLRESGFYKYVRVGGYKHIDQSNSTILQIRRGSKVNPNMPKDVCNFVNEVCGTNLLFTKDLYCILNEMMLNTVQHAYDVNKKYELPNNWYIFIQNRENQIRFVFLDTGEGIPQTIRKKPLERLMKSDCDFIYSALKGELRTSTGQPFRGKGLPRIFSKYINGGISELKILSDYGYCAFNKNNKQERKLINMNNSISGTLFCWELEKHSIRKEHLK